MVVPFRHHARGGWRATLQRAGWPVLVGLVAILLVILPWSGGGREAGAHAFLERSDPGANAVLPERVAEVRLWFTEPLEPDFTRATLYDADGNQVATEASRIGDDANLLILPLPAELPTGTCTVQWQNVSTADSHPEQGYVPFTIGSQADVVTPITPDVTKFNAAPTWLDALGRWLALLGVTAAVGAIVFWLYVLRDASVSLDDERYKGLQARLLALIFSSVGLSLLGNLIVLGVQAYNTGDGLLLSTISDVLLDTRFGFLWLARIMLLGGLITIATSDSIWDDQPSGWQVALSLGASGLALLPYSLNAHAAALEIGRTAALAADWLHLVATSVWIGGLLALLVALVYGTRGVAANVRRTVYATAISRFTTLAIASVIVLALTGFYSAWLHVGNLIALRETNYGQALIVKLLLLVPLLVLGFMNMRILGPRMLTAARTGLYFGRTIAAEAVLGVGVLAAVGLLTTFPTARDVVTNEAENTTYHIFSGDSHVVLYLSPGAVGFNRYTVDVDLDPELVTDQTQLLLRFSREGGSESVTGVREVALTHAFGPRFEGSGTELSVVGDWDVEAILREPGTGETRYVETVDIPRTPAAERVPGAPPRFLGWTPAVAMLFVGLGVMLASVFLRMPANWRDRVPEIGASTALVVAGIGILLVTRTEATPTTLAANPIPRTPESVAVGQGLFQENCAICHGATGEGDGPQAPNLNPPPANLTEAHVGDHTDGDINWWVRNGIQPAMPAFAETLSVDEIWHVINYVRSLSDPSTAGR